MNSNLVFDAEGRYSRTTSVTRRNLEKALAQSYGVSDACIFPSGMTAITFLFQIFAEKGESVVFLSDEVYCDTPRSLKMFKCLKTIRFNASDSLGFQTLFDQHKPSLVFLETFSNPSGIRFDTEILGIVNSSSWKCKIVVDNTFASSVLFNPFTNNKKARADLVVESLTKYVSGGMRIGGAVIGSEREVRPFKNIVRLYGLHIPDDHLAQIYENHKSIRTRVTQASDRAHLIYLKMLEMPIKVVTPLNTPAFPTIAFRAKTNLRKDQILMIDNGVLWETSYGSPYSKICNWIKVRDSEVECRLSVGYESDVNEIVASLEKMIDAFVQ